MILLADEAQSSRFVLLLYLCLDSFPNGVQRSALKVVGATGWAGGLSATMS